MTDDFLNEVRKNWRGLDERTAGMAKQLERERLHSRMAMAATFAGTIGAMCVGGWLLIWGLDAEHIWLERIAGLVLLLAVPLLTFASWSARGGEPRWELETPETVLQYALRRQAIAAKLLNVACWNGYVLLGLVAALWLAALGKLVPFDGFLVGFSLFYLAIAGFLIARAERRRRDLASESAHCQAMLTEYQ